jgi:F0F1-type ATP synthase assembly protein I
LRGTSVYTGASILGPLLLFSSLGILLDKYFQSSPLFTLIFIGLAFIFTNILLFRKTKMLSKEMKKFSRQGELSKQKAFSNENEIKS